MATSLYWQHLAVKHHSAFFEADSWGSTKFKWNDVSYAHAPFQDDTWEKVQGKLFMDKISTLGFK